MPSIKPIPYPLYARRDGAALVFVLAALALISFLALAILTLIRSEDRGSRTAADLTELRLMAELPEKLVISQIRRATKGLGTRYTWTSQPGMIRVFGDEATSGLRPKAEELYKLYSAPVMTLGSGGDPLKDGQDFVNWSRQPGVFTDLNEPVRVLPVREQGKVQRYDQPTFQFPILDPGAVNLYDGFTMVSGTYDLNPENPRLPMPVAWLYVLKNGKLAAATGGAEGVVKVADATKDNPIIGRIAFWTDDESCKLNLNTATEPAPWEPPHTRTVTDEAYAKTIPAKGEFYRMSGHPAYTSLAPVLRRFGKVPGEPTLAEREPQDTYAGGSTWWRHLQDYHRLLPRTLDTTASTGTLGGTASATDQVLPKQERFFGTVDEFFFNAEIKNDQRTTNSELGVEQRFTQDDIRKSRFFLTTHSRAPELNPFNRPKISLWPVQENTSQRNEVDEALVQAATLGDDVYFFQRASEWTSPTAPGSSQSPDRDLSIQRNNELIGYLLDMSERDIPGFGGRFVDAQAASSGKYSAESRDQLVISMFDMIRWGVNPASPTTSAFGTEYRFMAPSLGSDNIEGSAAWSAVPSVFEGLGPDLIVNGAALQATRGMGRFPVFTEAVLVLAASQAERVGGVLVDANNDGFGDVTKELQAYMILEPYCVSPGTPGFSPRYVYRIQGLDQLTIEGKPLNLPADIISEVSYSPSLTLPSGAGVVRGDQAPFTGIAGQLLQSTGGVRTIQRKPSLADQDQDFAIVSSAVIPLTPAEGKFDNKLKLGGAGIITLSIYDTETPFAVGKRPVQEVRLDVGLFANEFLGANPAKIPVPLMAAFTPNVDADQQMEERITPIAEGSEGLQFRNIIRPGDVTRSVELAGAPSGGDVRILAGHLAVQSGTSTALNWFAPNPLSQPNNYRADSLRDGAHMLEPQIGAGLLADPRAAPTGRIPGEVASPLVMRPDSSANFIPLLPGERSLPATTTVLLPTGSPLPVSAINRDLRPGDFNNGPGIIEDGPYSTPPTFDNALNESAVFSASGAVINGGLFERGGLFTEDDGSTWLPQRQAPSAFLFGSLPSATHGTGLTTDPRPWQTLLFCPNPASRRTAAGSDPVWLPSDPAKQDHFGFKSPRDHLWLEFFHLPITEPEGFGDAVSTEGKVNMNYQMMPFTWINRATAMHGALHGVRLTAIPSKAVAAVDNAGVKINNDLEHYKIPPQPPNATPGTPRVKPSTLQFRYAVDADLTLKAFEEEVFKVGEVFRSPSEICDIWLMPKRLEGHKYEENGVTAAPPPPSYTGLLEWWEGISPTDGDPTNGFEATGDNLREAPYAQLYPRLCTKSNVFTVHYRVQLLKKSRSTKPDEWDVRRDSVAAEHRGQTTIERYLDLNKKTIPDFVTTINANEALDDYYNIRVVNRRDFKP